MKDLSATPWPAVPVHGHPWAGGGQPGYLPGTSPGELGQAMAPRGQEQPGEDPGDGPEPGEDPGEGPEPGDGCPEEEPPWKT